MNTAIEKEEIEINEWVELPKLWLPEIGITVTCDVWRTETGEIAHQITKITPDHEGTPLTVRTRDEHLCRIRDAILEVLGKRKNFLEAVRADAEALLPELDDDEIEDEDLDSGVMHTTEDQIRAAYGRLKKRKHDWISLTALRKHISAEREAVDAALLAMSLRREIVLTPECDQRRLTADDRAAAVRIGRNHMHLVTFRER